MKVFDLHCDTLSELRYAEKAGAPAAWGRFFLSVKWLCAPRGPEVGRGVSTPPSLPLDSTLPATS